MRKIPATMATQHPDNALAPFWDEQKDPFISVYKEIDDAIVSFNELGVSEFMWDWEGKHADAAVIDRLFTDNFDYFSKKQLGRDKFLTFRIPNIWEEKGYNLLQAMTVVLSGEDFARDLKFDKRPLFEVILPMTERPEQLMRIHKLFSKLAQFKSSEFTKHEADNNNYLELMPLVESVKSQLDIGNLLERYIELHQQHFGFKPDYIRPFLACSDPALMSGKLATILTNKLALSQIYRLSKESNIPMYPISGPGSLIFRGGLNPDSVDDYLREYAGVRTVTVQSAFRFDNPTNKVRKAIEELEKRLPKTKPVIFDDDTEKKLTAIVNESEKIYQKTLSSIVPDVQSIFSAVPKRRERRQHIGLLAYGRKVGTQKMPRAITFTCGFYSLGIPPEFIGLGRTLQNLKDSDLDLIKDTYKSIKNDIEIAGRYLNTDNLEMLISRNPAWGEVKKDIELTKKILDIKTGPKSLNEKKHYEVTSEIVRLDGKELTKKIVEAGVLRKSLG